MATIANPITRAAAPSAEAAAKSNLDPANTASKETFLKLLVAQIRNQNPLNPADGIEFVAQLAQFSQLEQLIEIRSGIESMGKQTAPGQSSQNPATPIS
ncbi:MAG: hypothetical protein FJW37_06255 [Acidobacteria bacterium]|nr:hypothetical protein [Acidobacteriota bacterium]